jgi:hypothetical protein
MSGSAATKTAKIGAPASGHPPTEDIDSIKGRWR